MLLKAAHGPISARMPAGIAKFLHGPMVWEEAVEGTKGSSNHRVSRFLQVQNEFPRPVCCRANGDTLCPGAAANKVLQRNAEIETT